jgi:transposase-like protein
MNIVGGSLSALAERRKKAEKLMIDNPDWSDAKIGREVGVSREAARQWRKRFGVARPTINWISCSPEKRKQAEKLMIDNPGWNDKEIAGHLGVSTTTINKWRKQLGIPLAPSRTFYPSEKREQAKNLMIDNPDWNDARIARAVGVSTTTINVWRKQLGISPSRVKANAYPPEKRDQVKKLMADNPDWSNRKIARDLNMSITTINVWRKQFGVFPSRIKTNGYPSEKTQQARNMVTGNPDWSDARIARAVGVGRATIARWRKAFKQFT